MAGTTCVFLYPPGEEGNFVECADCSNTKIADDTVDDWTFYYDENRTVGCVEGPKVREHVNGKDYSVEMIGFFYFILACIFIGLVYGVVVVVQKKYRARVRRRRHGPVCEENINYNDEEDIEMDTVGVHVDMCGEEELKEGLSNIVEEDV